MPPGPFERKFAGTGITRLAGVDEAGRGALFGPVVAAAVILDPTAPWPGVADSKTLTPATRGRLFGEITSRAEAWAVGLSEPREIDESDILQATLMAMARAVDGLGADPQMVLVDGNVTPRIQYPCEAVVHGDALSISIGAASIVAKVWRDRLLSQWGLQFPGYGLERNKGYGTGEHLAALRRLGPTPMHRRTFRGVLPRGLFSGPAFAGPEG